MTYVRTCKCYKEKPLNKQKLCVLDYMFHKLLKSRATNSCDFKKKKKKNYNMRLSKYDKLISKHLHDQEDVPNEYTVVQRTMSLAYGQRTKK